jgi:hypothetical protein
LECRKTGFDLQHQLSVDTNRERFLPTFVLIGADEHGSGPAVLGNDNFFIAALDVLNQAAQLCFDFRQRRVCIRAKIS